MKIRFDLTSSRALLVSLRVLAVMAFVGVTIAMVFPRTIDWMAGACVSMTGILAIQLFRLKSVEEKPDARDRDMRGLRLNDLP